MPLASANFGLRALEGKHCTTIIGKLPATHVAIAPGDVMNIPSAGAGVQPLAGLTTNADTVAYQINIVGVATHGLAANTGGLIEMWDPWDNLFEVQSTVIGTGWDAIANVGKAYPVTNNNSAISSSTGFRATGLTVANAANGALCIFHWVAKIPGNDLTATSYPIFVVRINPWVIVGGGKNSGAFNS